MNAESECRQLVAQYAKAVHTQIRTDFDAAFARRQECRLISIDREFVGVDAIYQQFLVEGIGAKFSRITLVTDELAFNRIAPDMMIIVFRYHTECELRSNGEAFGIRGMETQVAIREADEWRLVHVHYSKGV